MLLPENASRNLHRVRVVAKNILSERSFRVLSSSEVSGNGRHRVQVPYREVGLFFNITETSKWLINAKAEWQLHPTIRSEHETEARWWVPDTHIGSDFIQVRPRRRTKLSLKPGF